MHHICHRCRLHSSDIRKCTVFRVSFRKPSVNVGHNASVTQQNVKRTSIVNITQYGTSNARLVSSSKYGKLNGKILTKKQPIRTLGVTSRLHVLCHIITYFIPRQRKYSQSEYREPLYTHRYLNPTFPLCAARMPHCSCWPKYFPWNGLTNKIR